MALSNDLVTAFATFNNDSKKDKKKEATVYGTVKKVGDKLYVQLDGSELLTPVDTVANMEEDERAIVQIKDHTATIIGNVTSPSARTGDVKVISDEIIKVNQVVANKVDVATLDAEVARIDELIAGKAEIGELDAKYATISQLEAYEANIEKLETDKLDASEADITFAKVEELNAMTADIENLKTDKLDADYADLYYAKISELNATNAKINDLDTKKLDAESAEIKFANIDFSNIDQVAVEKLFGDSGIIKDLIMQDGKVTGELVGVTIKGDLIEGNTVKADKLVILGEDGLYYKLNVNSLGETEASSDEKYQNGLDGSVIVAESITTDKIYVTDLEAFGATIGGYHIDKHSLYSGVKTSADNTTEGVFLGDDGQMAVGDSNNFLRYIKDADGNSKLEIQSSEIRFNAESDPIEEVINNIDLDTDGRLNSVDTTITTLQSTINQISSMISTLVTDGNGGSLMTQTSNGWTFDMSSVNENLDTIKKSLNNLGDTQNDTDDTIKKLSDLVNSIATKTAYITISTDENGSPCIELGKTDNKFKVRITNTAIDFLEGLKKIAYANNSKFYSESMEAKELGITNEKEDATFVWKVRDSGNLGLIYM